ncbi:MAG: hypothetical protein ACK5EA_17420, partial [Planctomycetaceae bacterium]
MGPGETAARAGGVAAGGGETDTETDGVTGAGAGVVTTDTVDVVTSTGGAFHPDGAARNRPVEFVSAKTGSVRGGSGGSRSSAGLVATGITAAELT